MIKVDIKSETSMNACSSVDARLKCLAKKKRSVVELIQIKVMIDN